MRLRSVAATIALPNRDTPSSTSRWLYAVGAGGCLDVDPRPLIIAGGAEHAATTVVSLTHAARIRLREQVQLGRDGEDTGLALSRPAAWAPPPPPG